ncbi:MAG: type VI secretion system contractile sheath large subunit [Rhodospirillales bacterium]|nr:type VI secretion system contractile sheath large subunit [Rhodospirillales bacterium]
MPGPLEFEFRFARPDGRPARRRDAESPFRILVMGDFSGGCPRAEAGCLEDRPLIPVDIDNFDRAVARLAPRAAISLEGRAADAQEIAFGALDDFHPDALAPKLEVFRELWRLRERLLDPATFEETAAGMTRDAEQASASEDGPGPAPDAAPDAAPEDHGATFERLLGRRVEPGTDAGGPTVAQTGATRELIERLVEPHLVRGADPERQRLLVAAVDDGLAREMAAVLHDPAFQTLEAAWRGLYWLASSLETGEELSIHLLDASKQELAADIGAAGAELEASALYRRLVEQRAEGPDGEPWSLIVGDYRFGPAEEDLSLLAALGAIASRAGGPFLAAADPALLGCRSLAETPDPGDWTGLDPETAGAWQVLRRSAVGPWIGLALPRVLLRLPYGRQTDPIEAFAFEELPGVREHEAYLWGNPAFACALLIGQAFQENGWELQPGDRLDIADLPAHSYTEEGESRLKPCAEVLLSQRAAEAVLARGIMPLLSHRNANAVRVLRFQSLAEPPTALAGPWA